MRAQPAIIQVIGSGEAFDTDVGNTSYLFSAKGLPTILFDCGYQIPERLWKIGLHRQLDAVCLTHLHADHSFGIVPLLVRYGEEQRQAPLSFIGPRGTEAFINRLLEMGYPGFKKRLSYPIYHLALHPRRALRFQGLSLSCARTVHSVLNYTVRVDGPTPGSFSFAVSGDGQITEETKMLVRDVDLLFQEIYSVGSEVPTHSDFKTISGWISETQIKTIVTAHFARSKKAELSQRISSRKSDTPRWLVAKPGMRLKLRSNCSLQF